ncbi:SusC/RagA family TonB-linked outer membrane protein [Winogradskyella maritima]|uniref:SusC/RagA family TonB-linked outer membrane protein n=1 Tax=Winogradskyella maritima TaxID=1517766 RepID=A0ABV8AJX7_9FLAO|nr:SusC/RagA family TonB-linked outer membrane protein [Winogradskyella maritima]
MKLKLTWLLALFMAFVMQFSFAQEKTVTGTITAASDGLPLPGVNVIVKGTTRGTQTDFDGNYSLRANSGDVIVFSYLGYKNVERTVGAASTISLSMEEDAESLDEIVIVGSVFDVGKERKNGVSSIGANELKAVVATTSIDRAMQGQMSGVSVVASSTAPGSAANVNVRGAFSPSTANGLRNPLYVVDGTYMNQADIPAINSSNIESMQVLTDASQTAIYGSRGSNGVVIITTKKGVEGEPRFSLNARYGVSDRFPIRVDLMNSRQKLEYENALSQVTDPFTGNPLGLGRSYTDAQINELSQVDTDWADILYKTGFTESYNFSVSSGTENSNTRISLGYDSDEGIAVGYEGFQRLSASLTNNLKTDKFNIGYTVNGVYTRRDDPRDRQNVQSPFWSEINNNPYEQLFQVDGNGNQILDANGDPIFNISGRLNSFGYQVLDEIFGTDQEVRNVRFFGNAYAEYFILKDLKIRTQFGAVYDRRQSENFLKPSARLNTFIGTQGLKTDTSTDDFDYNWRNELTYGRSFGDHNFKATFATEYQDENNYFINLNSRTFPNDFQDTQNLAGSIDQDSFTRRTRISRVALLGVLNYNYDGKYFFDGYVRRDGSSLAGLDNQYGTFYGASLAWDIAKESFMDSAGWVNSLRLSGSYGTLGDDAVLGLYTNFTAINQGGLLGNDPIATPNFAIANPNVTWESNEKINLGIAFELLQGSRLRGKVDWFQDTRKDFLFADSLPFESGAFNTTVNLGDSRVSGLEVDLNYDVLRNPDGLNLTVFGNITALDYEITSLGDEQIRNYSGGQSILREGLEPFTHYLVRYAGVNPANGDAIYLDVDGNETNVFSAANAVPIGDKSPLPEFFGGFGLRANYRGFDLSSNFNYTYGNYVFNQQSLGLHDPANWRNNKVVGATNYWQQPGDTGVFQRPTVNGIEANTTQFLQDASYLSWRNLTFGYTFGENVFSGTGINTVRAYFQAQNLAIWSGFQGNPEVGIGSSENGATVSNSVYINGYPQIQSFSFGFDINF